MQAINAVAGNLSRAIDELSRMANIQQTQAKNDTLLIQMDELNHKLHEHDRRRLLLLTFSELDRFAKKTAAKLKVKPTALLDSSNC
jgi:hypothetical protein